MRRSSFLIVFCVVISAQHVFALWDRSCSIEWWVNVSDSVAICRMVDTEPLEPRNTSWDSHEVTCKLLEILKGSTKNRIVFRQDYPNMEKWKQRGVSEDAFDPTLEKGDRVLVFLAADYDTREEEVIFWMNLTRLDVKAERRHAAFNNECQQLKDETSIISLVKSRIMMEETDGAGKRGIVLEFSATEHPFMHWDFVRTAEPEIKVQFVELLKSESPRDRAYAIFNLVSYPDDETVNIIRPFLNDNATSVVGSYKGTLTVTNYYPVRQAAYLALTLLGDKDVVQPKPYYQGIRTFEFTTGFENTSYFPYGKWKRLPGEF